MLSNVIKQGGKNWEQGNGGVVDVLGHTFHLLWEEKQATKTEAEYSMLFNY